VSHRCRHDSHAGEFHSVRVMVKKLQVAFFILHPRTYPLYRGGVSFINTRHCKASGDHRHNHLGSDASPVCSIECRPTSVLPPPPPKRRAVDVADLSEEKGENEYILYKDANNLYGVFFWSLFFLTATSILAFIVPDRMRSDARCPSDVTLGSLETCLRPWTGRPTTKTLPTWDSS